MSSSSSSPPTTTAAATATVASPQFVQTVSVVSGDAVPLFKCVRKPKNKQKPKGKQNCKRKRKRKCKQCFRKAAQTDMTTMAMTMTTSMTMTMTDTDQHLDELIATKHLQKMRKRAKGVNGHALLTGVAHGGADDEFAHADLRTHRLAQMRAATEDRLGIGSQFHQHDDEEESIENKKMHEYIEEQLAQRRKHEQASRIAATENSPSKEPREQSRGDKATTVSPPAVSSGASALESDDTVTSVDDLYRVPDHLKVNRGGDSGGDGEVQSGDRWLTGIAEVDLGQITQKIAAKRTSDATKAIKTKRALRTVQHEMGVGVGRKTAGVPLSYSKNFVSHRRQWSVSMRKAGRDANEVQKAATNPNVSMLKRMQKDLVRDASALSTGADSQLANSDVMKAAIHAASSGSQPNNNNNNNNSHHHHHHHHHRQGDVNAVPGVQQLIGAAAAGHSAHGSTGQSQGAPFKRSTDSQVARRFIRHFLSQKRF